MRVLLTKPEAGIAYDITSACAKVTWSGSASSPCRQATFDYLNAPYDNVLKIPTVSTGDFVSLVDDTAGEIFYGEIFGVERSSQIGTITYTAVDMMKNLLESKGQYVFRNVTPEAVAAQVCADAQIPTRFLYPTGVNIKTLICDDMSLHDVIMAAYTKAHKITGKKFFPMIYKRGFSVYRTKWYVDGMTLSEDTNIFSSSITESVDKLVNVVKVYDKKGVQIGEQRIDESVKKYGVFQDNYTVEDGIDPSIASYHMLNVKPSQSIKISAIGDTNCISCYYVPVHDSATGLDGKYWISSDSHTWENGNHKMDLELQFEAIMSEVKAEEEKETKKTKKEAKK